MCVGTTIRPTNPPVPWLSFHSTWKFNLNFFDVSNKLNAFNGLLMLCVL